MKSFYSVAWSKCLIDSLSWFGSSHAMPQLPKRNLNARLWSKHRNEHMHWTRYEVCRLWSKTWRVHSGMHGLGQIWSFREQLQTIFRLQRRWMYGEVAAMPGNIRVLITVCYNWSRYSGLKRWKFSLWRILEIKEKNPWILYGFKSSFYFVFLW